MSVIGRREALAAIGGGLVYSGCSSPPTAEQAAPDPHSYAQPAQARVQHVALDLAVAFEERTLAGTVVLDVEGDSRLVLDTRDLTIESVEASPDGTEFRPARWELGVRDKILGAPLTVQLPAGARSVRIRYETSPQASGLQWLEPQQTAGKRRPFLFSQSQSIHARSWIPLQDSPGVRVTYSASIRAPQGLRALMSAEQLGAAGGVFEFAMDRPVPPYLIARAVGEIGFAALGPRTGVYAEPPVLARAAAEFEDMEKLVSAAESLYGPYRWGRYDLLILPPSFPYGGMENPRLTFATPTVIAGDKSMVSLVSHELAHSWSGNLVTNATWSDFWLNEGFTTYLENRIQEAVYGRELALMEQALARRSLDRELAELPERDQVLHIDLRGRDPDEGVTGVPYNKGSLLLRKMEEAFGRETFDAYLKRYFDHFAFQSITTETMLDYLKRELLDPHPDQAARIALEEWIYQPGLPASAPRASSERLRTVAQQAAAFKAGGTARAIDAQGWSTQEWLEFLQEIAPPDAARMADLDARFRLTRSGNSEIASLWLRMAIAAGYEPAYSRLENFLLEVGRQKLIRPLYTELMKTPEGQQRARAIYAKARPRYHPIAQTAMDRIVMPQ
jgi:leukotriene-A4 hydrolase